MKARILFVTKHNLQRYPEQAGHRTALDNLKRLSEKYVVDVLIVCNSSEGDSEYVRSLPNVNVILFKTVSPIEKLLLVLRRFVTYSPKLAVRAVKVGEITDYQKNYEFVWVEFTESMPILDGMKIDCEIRLNVHDVLIQMALRSRGILRFFSSRIYADEARILRRADRIYVQSEKDRKLIYGLFGIQHLEVVPPSLSPFIKRVRRNANLEERFTLIFWGAMSRPENYRAIEDFIKSSWPEIVRKKPEAKLYVVGSSPPKGLARSASDSVTVTGYVEDPTEFFQRAKIGIAPLKEGAGIKVKVLEMLHAGLEVVATSIAAEGVEQTPKLHVVEPQDFSKVIIELMN